MVGTEPTLPSLFRGPASLRTGGERATLVRTLIALVVLIAGAQFLTYFVSTIFSWKEVAIVIVVGMVYVTLGRGRLLGASIRVHAQQFGHVHDIVEACAAMLKMPTPHVFVRDDPFMPIVSVGLGEPYAIVISAQWVDHISPDELRFLVGRELGHILAGHTRITSLLSVNGRENAVVSILFGAWLRKIEYSADRAGLLCARSLDATISAISVSAFHSVGRKIDLAAFADQQRELEAEPALRMGEWISSTPYATNRISALRVFARDRKYFEWVQRLDRELFASSHPLETDASADQRTARKIFAGPLRRFYAFLVDFALVNALLPPNVIKHTSRSISFDKGDAPPGWVVALAKFVDHSLVPNDQNLVFFAIFVYSVVLVGIAGQTCGMMIFDLRVVSARFGKIGIGGAIWRYIMLVVSYFFVPVGWFRFWGRVQPYEKWSRSRIVQGAQLAARIESVTAPQ